MNPVETHVLNAITFDGAKVELGRLGSLELAARMRDKLSKELGDEYLDFEIVEREIPPPSVSAVRREALRRRLASTRKTA
jgi:hypothetical protein